LACAIFSSGLQLPLSRPDGWRRKEREAKLFSNIFKIIYFYITYISKLTFEPQIQMASSHSTEVLYLAAWQAHHQSEDTLAGGGLERDRVRGFRSACLILN